MASARPVLLCEVASRYVARASGGGMPTALRGHVSDHDRCTRFTSQINAMSQPVYNVV